MSAGELDSRDLSVFCAEMAQMLGAGVLAEDAVWALAQDTTSAALRRAAHACWAGVSEGLPLSDAMQKCGAFPANTVALVRTGEATGHVDAALDALAGAHAQQAAAFEQMRAALGHPAALMCVMCVILAAVNFAILPLFIDVYNTFTGSITAGSFGAVGAAAAIGNVTLVACAVLAALAVAAYFMSASASGQQRLMALGAHVPGVRAAQDELALAQFSLSFASYAAAGLSATDALEQAKGAATQSAALAAQLERAQHMLTQAPQPCTLEAALEHTHVYTSAHAHMLAVGSQTGSLPATLTQIAAAQAQAAYAALERAVGAVEPVLAALMTLGVCAALMAVMLPLVGIMVAMA